MAKDPAFLFYPGDWLQGTMGMTFEEQGAYLNLLMFQFNNGKFSKASAKLVLSICSASAFERVLQKFDTDGTFFWKQRLFDEMDKRKRFTESRRKNAKGVKNKEFTPKTTKAYAKHMENENEDVIENENTIELILKNSFDEIYMEQQKMKWPHLDFDFEHRTFCEKVRGSPSEYGNRDTNSIRLAFQYQLRNSKGKKNGHSKNKQSTADLAEAFAIRVMQNNSGQQFSGDK
jgi:uncharacterized protein YdaU (DUF1376 family)